MSTTDLPDYLTTAQRNAITERWLSPRETDALTGRELRSFSRADDGTTFFEVHDAYTIYGRYVSPSGDEYEAWTLDRDEIDPDFLPRA